MDKLNMASLGRELLRRSNLLFSRKRNMVGQSVSVVRYGKHYDPKFKWHRKMKYIDVGIDFNKKLTREEKELAERERGVFLMRRSTEVPIYIDSSLGVFDPYVPTEGDGKYTSLSDRITSKLNIRESTMKKGKNLIALRKIRKYLANFDEEGFAQKGLDIYIKAHSALASNDMDELEKYATDYAISLMMKNTENKTLRWKYIESLEPPKTVQVRTAAVGMESNLFAQITVRFHSKQMLAIYDRFGRLMYGSEILAKDVLEFAVFEIHLVNMNGTFKLHQKIIPDWVEQKYPHSRTYTERTETEEIEEDMGEEYKLISEVEDEMNKN